MENNRTYTEESTEALIPPKPLPNHPWRKRVIAGLLFLLVFGGGYQLGHKGYVWNGKDWKIVNQSEVPKNVDYNLLWDAMKVVDSKFIGAKPTPEEYLYGAAKGAVAATNDPYTAFFSPKELEIFNTDLKGNFDGIGAEIGKQGGNIVIIAPLDGTPAKRAGLMPKDIILKVDGVSTADWTTDEAVNHIRGKRGTKVVLTIAREGRLQPFDVEIIRDQIVIKSVKWEYKNVGGKQIAVITISRFGDDTLPLFEKAVNEIISRSVNGVIVDLRNNPGGYLQTAVDVASAWVKSGDVVVKETKSQGGDQIYTASGLNRLGGIKTIVLINGGSASAAEILAGALRDNNKATLLGEKSFGKGSVQELVNLKEGGAVKVTVAKWITPGGKNLDKDGLNPDLPVKLSEDDLKNGKDPQMDKALEEIIK